MATPIAAANAYASLAKIGDASALTKNIGATGGSTGPNFGALHVMFENQYNELFAANDVIAERIRALGEFAPGSLAAFQRRSAVEDAPDKPPAAEAMIAALVRDHELISGRCSALREVADDSDDTATGDLMNERMAAHDKHAWMLRSHLQ